MSTARNIQSDTTEHGPGLAPLLVCGVVAGTVSATLALVFSASWPVVLLAYWLAGTLGALSGAVLAAGIVRLPRLRSNREPGYSFAMARARP